MLPGEGGGARSLVVLFPWSEEGYCAKQFRVSVTESPTRVTVGQVHEGPLFSVERTCEGIGVAGGLASVSATLEQPLRDRPVYRAVDVARLGVRP